MKSATAKISTTIWSRRYPFDVDTVVKRDTKSACARIRSQRHLLLSSASQGEKRLRNTTRQLSFLASVKQGVAIFDSARNGEATKMENTTAAKIFETTRLLKAWSEGDETALERLVPLVDAELRRLARYYLCQERQGHILQT